MFQAARLSGRCEDFYEQYVNPQWVRLLDILNMNVTYDAARAQNFILPEAGS